MESNGARNRIHISADTAELLCKVGKSHWVTPRKDKIFAKGKGEMSTYWVSNRTAKSAGGSSTGSVSLGRNQTSSSRPTKDTFQPRFEPTQEEGDDDGEHEQRSSFVADLLNSQDDEAQDGDELQGIQIAEDWTESESDGTNVVEEEAKERDRNFDDDIEHKQTAPSLCIKYSSPPVNYSDFLKKS